MQNEETQETSKTGDGVYIAGWLQYAFTLSDRQGCLERLVASPKRTPALRISISLVHRGLYYRII
jgi:hypothetical protein